MKSFIVLCWSSFLWTVLSNPMKDQCNSVKDIVNVLQQHQANSFCSSFISIAAAPATKAAVATSTVTATTTFSTTVTATSVSTFDITITSGTVTNGIAASVVTSTTTDTVTTTLPTVTITVLAKRELTSNELLPRKNNGLPKFLSGFRPNSVSAACSCLLSKETNTPAKNGNAASPSQVITATTVSVTNTFTITVDSTKTATVTVKATKPATLASNVLTTTTTTITIQPTVTVTASAGGVEVFLRIEGSESTIFQGTIQANPGNVTTPSGGTHLCDGTNNGANPKPGGNPTNALAEAAAVEGFGFDGTFDSTFDDFFITSIGGTTETSTEFWGLLVNYQFTPVGGCQFEPSTGQEVLWAFNAFNAVHFLKLAPVTGGTGPATIAPGSLLQFVVTDGSTGAAIAGALVGEQTSDVSGLVTITFPEAGQFILQATRSDSIRSQLFTVIVA